MYCPMVNAEREDSPLFGEILLRADLEQMFRLEYWNDICSGLCAVFNVPKKETTRQERRYFLLTFSLDTYDYLLNVSELESTLTAVSAGMEGYNVMIEDWGSATSQYPFSPPKWSASFDHQIVLLKILSVLELSGPLKWKLNFLWRPKLLKREEKRRGELIKRCENDTNWIAWRKKKHIWPYPCVWQKESNQVSQLSTDEEITLFFCIHVDRKENSMETQRDCVLSTTVAFTHI